MHDRGAHEHKCRLSAIRAWLDYSVVGQVLPRIYRIPDIKVGRVFYRQTTSRSISAHTGSAALPAGITVEGATPHRGGEMVNFGVHHLSLPGGAPAPKNGGSLPPLSPLSCGAPPRRARGGRARRSLAWLCRSGRGESVPTRVQ